jgi:hypothetical protein
MKAKAQITMAKIMGRGGLPLEGFIVAEVEGAKLVASGCKRMNLCNKMMMTYCRGFWRTFLWGF